MNVDLELGTLGSFDCENSQFFVKRQQNLQDQKIVFTTKPLTT
jgi:hypothetical protein